MKTPRDIVVTAPSEWKQDKPVFGKKQERRQRAGKIIRKKARTED